MRGFVATYRWELWLLLWVPLLGNVMGVVGLPLLLYLVYFTGWPETPFISFSGVIAVALVKAGLLLAFYGRVQRLGRGFLTLVWGYSLLSAAIDAFVFLLGFVVSLALGEPNNVFQTSLVLLGVGLFEIILALPLLLWFARRASRISLAHALFLFLLFTGYGVIATLVGLVTTQLSVSLNSADSRAVEALLEQLWSLASTMVAGCVLAWLLGNFGSRGNAFRKRTVMALLAVNAVLLVWRAVGILVDEMEGFVGLLILVGGLLTVVVFSFILPLFLIYLVRVRQPAAVEQS